MTITWRVAPLGDAALLLSGEPSGPEVVRSIWALAAELEEQASQEVALQGVLGLTPGLDTLLVCYDPPLTDVASLRGWLLRRLRRAGSTTSAPMREVEIMVRYGGENGPDLVEVAQAAGLSAAQTVELHCGGSY